MKSISGGREQVILVPGVGDPKKLNLSHKTHILIEIRARSTTECITFVHDLFPVRTTALVQVLSCSAK